MKECMKDGCTARPGGEEYSMYTHTCTMYLPQGCAGCDQLLKAGLPPSDK